MHNVVREPVSVCMALYNGEKYIKEQIDSILLQLNNEEDELIIVDDYSKDNSIDIVKLYHHLNIHIYKNDSNLGYIKTFERAINISKNPIVFLSDQDDIWIQGRLQKMYDRLKEKDNWLLCSNFNTFNEEGKEILRFKTKLAHNETGENYNKNIKEIFKGNIAYFGCTMAFKSEIKKYILPFPDYIDAHDLWIAMLGNVMKKIIHLEDVTLLHRIHKKNTSFVKRKFYKKIYTRFLFFKTWLEANKRKYTTTNT